MTEPRPGTDKAEVSTTVLIDTDNEIKGTVRIAPAVLIQLIETTVKDIDGVIDLTSRKGKKRDSELEGKAFDDGKVRVVVDGDQIDTDIAITLRAGVNVADVAEKIRKEVGVAAGKMLGMHVRSVDIFVDSFASGAV